MGDLVAIKNVNNLVTRFATIGDAIIYLLIGLAFIYIIYGVVQYFIKGKEGETRHAAAMQIFWGLVGLAIILSIWGLVNVLIGTFGTVNVPPTDKFPTANFVTK